MAFDQLSEEQLNWRPNEESNSIANLIVHMEGNIRQRIKSGILGLPDKRDRDKEFDESLHFKKDDLKKLIEQSFDLMIETANKLSPEDLLKTQTLKNEQVTFFDLLNQSANHLSEHLGQILYIAKMLLNEQYITTSVPKKKFS